MSEYMEENIVTVESEGDFTPKEVSVPAIELNRIIGSEELSGAPKIETGEEKDQRVEVLLGDAEAAAASVQQAKWNVDNHNAAMGTSTDNANAFNSALNSKEVADKMYIRENAKQNFDKNGSFTLVRDVENMKKMDKKAGFADGFRTGLGRFSKKIRENRQEKFNEANEKFKDTYGYDWNSDKVTTAAWTYGQKHDRK